jgi:glycerol-3-phosphate dehydrogenase
MSCTAIDCRRAESDAAQTEVFDIVIIGAGITGACLFHQLRKKGYRVLLSDKSDFAGGTSQASAMMLWGGLAYLRSFDLATVARLSSSREALIRGMCDYALPRTFRYVVPSPKTGNRAIVQSALYLYWLLGGFRRTRPRLVEDFPERALLKALEKNCYEYEEAYLPDSDARFVIQWILRARDMANPALNYCQVEDGHFDRKSRLWTLDVNDSILGRQYSIRTKLIVNAAGVWTDTLNARFGIETHYKHLLSKGVFIGLRRDPSHNTPLILEKEDQDCYAFIPWGPVSLWGPTETFTSNPQEGFAVTSEDIQLLIDEYDRHFARSFRAEDVVSLRCGVRGLAVARSTQERSQNLSRKFVVQRDRDVPWVSIHGGKLTSCVEIAESAVACIHDYVHPSRSPLSLTEQVEPEMESFPGLNEKVPAARSCANESCWSLQDYLRRRTNISQWVPRGGLGHSNENAAHLERLSQFFLNGSPRAYQREIETKYDTVLAESSLIASPVEVL